MRLPHFAAMPPGDRGPLARSIARRHLEAIFALRNIDSGAARVAHHQDALSRLERAAARLGFDLALAELRQASFTQHVNSMAMESIMDRSEESKAKAEILQRTLESVCVKLQAEKGFTSEQVGLALSATGLKFLSEAWSGEQIVAHLAGLTTALAEMHDIDPETGRVGPKATWN